MNWTVTLIEAGVWCILFTIMMITISMVMIKNKDYSIASLDYPPAIVNRLIEQGKIKPQDKLPLKKRLFKKLPILIIYIIGFTCLLYFVNGARDFTSGFLSSFIIMITWTWYDALILDCVIFCNTKLFIIEGTEDMVKEYHDYMFHIKASCVGTVLSILGSLAIGGIIQLISIL